MLYYFEKESKFKTMLELGKQTQKGQLFLEHVTQIRVY